MKILAYPKIVDPGAAMISTVRSKPGTRAFIWSILSAMLLVALVHLAQYGRNIPIKATFLNFQSSIPDSRSLITQEIRYQNNEAGEVFLVWGINNWQVVPEVTRPAGTEVKNGLMCTPMVREGDTFVVKVQVPVDTTIDYVFQITKTRSGSAIEVWDVNGDPKQDYHTIAVPGAIAEVQASPLILEQIDAGADLEVELPWSIPILLVGLCAVCGIVAVRTWSVHRRLPQPEPGLKLSHIFLAGQLGQKFLIAVLSLIFLFSLRHSIFYSNGQDNLHVLQAEAFLQGQLNIEAEAPDVSFFEGKIFVPFPPAPAVLLLPIVAFVGGEATNVPLISLLLSLINIVVLAGILTRLQIDKALHFWLIAAFGLGTAYWLVVQWSNGVWFFAQVVAVTALLLAVFEALGRGRGWLVGILFGIAFLSRQMTLFIAIFLITALWENERWPEKRQKWRNLANFGLMLAGSMGMYLLFNYLRFGSPFDTGYAYLDHVGPLAYRFEDKGLFSLAYIPFNLIYLLFQGFHVEFQSPDALSEMVLDPYGTSLLSASPFFLVSFYARHMNRLVQSAWLTILLTVGITLCYYTNGWSQLNGQRYTLDFWPVLIVLVALGMQRQAQAGQLRLWQGLIVYAVGLNILALAFFDSINKFLDFWLTLF